MNNYISYFHNFHRDITTHISTKAKVHGMHFYGRSFNKNFQWPLHNTDLQTSWVDLVWSIQLWPSLETCSSLAFLIPFCSHVVVCNLDHCLCKVPMPYFLLSQPLFSWFAFTLTFDYLHELLNALSCEDYLGKGADTTLLGSKQCSPSIRQSTHFDVHCTS